MRSPNVAPPAQSRCAVLARASKHEARRKAFSAVLGASAAAALPALADAGVASNAALSVGAIAGVAGLGGLLIANDPQKRRAQMAQGAGGDEMKSVKDYFEGSGRILDAVHG
jgi:hypothetical protein